MNFEFMPELHQRWAYPAVWALMISVAVAMFLFFRRKGWIGEDAEDAEEADERGGGPPA
jgi:hypothetical protein